MRVTIPFRAQPLSVKGIDEDPGHERRVRASSGILVCGLEVLTPLAINSIFQNLRPDEKPYIPAATLRGAVRNMTEMLGGGCLRLVDRPGRSAPRHLETCTPAAACIACRTFGFTAGDECSWASKVTFSDATPASAQSYSWVYADARRSYTGDPPPADGWLLFGYNRVEVDTFRTGDRRSARCLAPGSRLVFRAEFLNLDPEERALFLFALTLHHGEIQLCHKLGYAKALGLGACRVEISRPQPVPQPGEEINSYLEGAAFNEIVGARSIV